MARRHYTRALFGLIPLALTMSCGGADDTEAPTSGDIAAVVAPVDGFIDGKLLHTFVQKTNHVLRFYEFDSGSTAVIEWMPAEDQALLDGIGKRTPLAEIYRRVRPGFAAPDALVAADGRATASRAAAVLKVKPPEADTVAPEPEPEPEVQALGCSADLFGDNWGASWFRTTQCTLSCSGGIDFWAECTTNNTLQRKSAPGSDWLKYKWFEGDFNLSGRAKATTSGFLYAMPKTWWNVAVAPRTVISTSFNGSGVSWETNTFEGSSPCGHHGRNSIICD